MGFLGGMILKELNDKINNILIDHLEHLVEDSRITAIKHLINLEINNYVSEKESI